LKAWKNTADSFFNLGTPLVDWQTFLKTRRGSFDFPNIRTMPPNSDIYQDIMQNALHFMAGCRHFAEIVERTIGLQLHVLRTMEPDKNDPINSILIDEEQAASLEDPTGDNDEESASSFSGYDEPVSVKEQLKQFQQEMVEKVQSLGLMESALTCYDGGQNGVMLNDLDTLEAGSWAAHEPLQQPGLS
jgi:hypothetical protein